MSKPRYNWWSFVLAMIRDYPIRRSEYKSLHQQKVTADLEGMPRGGGASRTTESISLRQLQPQDQREYDAVHAAVLRTRMMKEAVLRLKVVKLTMWQGYTIPVAAMMTNTSESTARRYRWEFAMLVGHKYGFLTEQEYLLALKKGVGK